MFLVIMVLAQAVGAEQDQIDAFGDKVQGEDLVRHGRSFWKRQDQKGSITKSPGNILTIGGRSHYGPR